jgi:hypothetical protein
MKFFSHCKALRKKRGNRLEPKLRTKAETFITRDWLKISIMRILYKGTDAYVCTIERELQN